MQKSLIKQPNDRIGISFVKKKKKKERKTNKKYVQCLTQCWIHGVYLEIDNYFVFTKRKQLCLMVVNSILFERERQVFLL